MSCVFTVSLSMSDDVLMFSSPVSPITTLRHDVTQPLTSTNNDTFADDVSVDRSDSIPYKLRVVGVSIGTVCLLAGVVGNLLILFSVWRYQPLRRTVNLFVASLAVCDLIQTLAVRTIHVQTYVAGHWTLGTRTCVYALVVGNLVILEDITRFLRASAIREKPTWSKSLKHFSIAGSPEVAECGFW